MSNFIEIPYILICRECKKMYVAKDYERDDVINDVPCEHYKSIKRYSHADNVDVCISDEEHITATIQTCKKLREELDNIVISLDNFELAVEMVRNQIQSISDTVSDIEYFD